MVSAETPIEGGTVSPPPSLLCVLRDWRAEKIRRSTSGDATTTVHALAAVFALDALVSGRTVNLCAKTFDIEEFHPHLAVGQCRAVSVGGCPVPKCP